MAVKRGNRTKRKNANRAKSKRDAVKRKRVRRRISLRKGKRAR